MFRKIVSNLPFSPALVGQLSFYAKRLRKEEATRRAGLIVTALALGVQSLAVFAPPEAANASSSADFIRGGVSSMSEYLKYYDRNSNNIKSVLSSLGVTRQELTNTKSVVIGEASRYNWSMTSLYSYAQGQRSYQFEKAGGSTGTVFYRPMRLTQEGGDRHPVFVGHSKALGWFAIKKDCGNLITATPPQPPKPVAACKNLNVASLSDTRFRFSAKADKKDGAAIKGYTYVVTNSDGKKVDTIKINSTKETNSTTYTQKKADKYTVRVTVRTSIGDRNDPDCKGRFSVVPPKTPAASCKALNVDVADRTIVSLAGRATTHNGAKVSKYTFVVKDAANKVVKTVTVKSSKLNVNAESFTLSKAGKYKVTLSVATSVGVKKDASDCAKQFKIVKPNVCAYNPELSPNSPDCQPCPDNTDLWIKDERCHAELISTKTAANMSRGSVDASTVTAKAGNKISYTVTIENKGELSTDITFKESLPDVLQYANLVDSGGGKLNKTTGELTWPTVNLAAHASQSRNFVVEMMNKIPVTNTGTSDATSYDCTMTNTFGNSIDIDVDCPITKTLVESTVAELPHTGPKENILFAGILLSVVVFFYARTRQLNTEVRLIRKDVNAGTI